VKRLLLLLVLGCQRPVVGADSGETLVFDLEVEPQFIRAQVPVDIRYRVSGSPPQKVTYDIGGLEFECEPKASGDGRFACTHEGIDREDLEQGTTLVVLEATDDDGRASIATTQVTIDYDCPTFAGLSVNPPIARANDTVTVTIEASERLREPPVVTRGGVSWEVPAGQGSSWTLTHDVSVADPASIEMIVVRLVDLAGNTSGDCSIDGRLPFGVDHDSPTVDPQKIRIDRMEPGVASTITAEPGAFFDDVQIDEVRLHDELGQLFAAIRPAADGSIPTTHLGAPTSSRITVEAVDLLGQSSPPVTVPERWRLSIGAGSTPDAALRTAVRLNPAPASSLSMTNRTATFAPNVREADARQASVRAQVGFHHVGDLPSRYEDTHNIVGGYDPYGKAILAIGGLHGKDFNLFDAYMSDVLVIRWDEDEGRYVHEPGPLLDIDDPESPDPRFGINIAFDGEGCGVIHGGRALSYDGNGGYGIYFSYGTYQLCLDPVTRSYSWSFIDPVLQPGDVVSSRVAPITWDPLNRRYVISGDTLDDTDRVRFLIPPGPGETAWQMINVLPLPSNFVDRSRHYMFFDPRMGGINMGAGGVSPIGNGEQYLSWTYLDGQWSASQIADDMVFRRRFGFDYDWARHQLVVWGGNTTNDDIEADPSVHLMTDTATNGPSAWRVARLDAPVPREFPTVVYDRDREVTVVFGGVRFNDERWVPPEIHEIVTQPSYPYLQASIDLDATRPKGIDRLELLIGATGSGDGDALGASDALADGVVVMLWDQAAREWVEAGSPDPEDPSRIRVVLTSDVERFVLPEGVVPVTLRSRWPATEAQSARLDVDVIDGWLHLRAGVTL
jgi:hypothetical protein